MDTTHVSPDGLCRVESMPLPEYQMGVFPERLTVSPPVTGIEHFYFMGGQVKFVPPGSLLLMWDTDDLVVFDYKTGHSYAFQGPLNSKILDVFLGSDDKTIDVLLSTKGEEETIALVLGAKKIPLGLGRLSDGVFMSMPWAVSRIEHHAQRPSAKRNGLLQRLKNVL